MKKKITAFEWIVAILLLIILEVMCLWCIDVSLSAMLTPNAVLTNGWQVRDPMLMYHFGIYGSLIIPTTLAVIGIYFVLKGKENVSNH